MPLRTLLSCCAAIIGLALPAHAEEAAARVHYAGYVKGLNLFDLDVAMSLRKTAYRLQASFRLTGVLGALIHADGTLAVDGQFDGARALPRQAFSTGQFRGAPHVIQIDWLNGSPKVVQMVPAPEGDREPVPESEQAHTVDPLSAIAVLWHQVAETGACEAATRTYDGIRLSEFAARTAGEETLEPTSRSSFQGRALRCDITGRTIGGFERNGDVEGQRKPKQGSAWFARLQPGQPVVPVRIALYAKGSTAATLYLREQPDAQDGRF